MSNKILLNRITLKFEFFGNTKNKNIEIPIKAYPKIPL